MAAIPTRRHPRQAPDDPRRRRSRCSRARASTTAACPTWPTRPGWPTGWSTTTSIRRRRSSTSSSSSAGRSCSTRSRRSTRLQEVPVRDKLYMVAELHHRLLPPRAGPDEGDHRRGHARGELLRPPAPGQDPRGLRGDRGDRGGGRLDGSFKSDIDSEFAAMCFYGAIEQVLSGWIFDLLPADRGGVRAREGPGGGRDLRRLGVPGGECSGRVWLNAPADGERPRQAPRLERPARRSGGPHHDRGQAHGHGDLGASVPRGSARLLMGDPARPPPVRAGARASARRPPRQDAEVAAERPLRRAPGGLRGRGLRRRARSGRPAEVAAGE